MTSQIGLSWRSRQRARLIARHAAWSRFILLPPQASVALLTPVAPLHNVALLRNGQRADPARCLSPELASPPSVARLTTVAAVTVALPQLAALLSVAAATVATAIAATTTVAEGHTEALATDRAPAEQLRHEARVDMAQANDPDDLGLIVEGSVGTRSRQEGQGGEQRSDCQCLHHPITRTLT